MPAANRRRNSLLQEIAQCLMRLAESRAAPEALDALAAFLETLAVWHSVDVFADGRIRRRLVSHRCPRGFAPFVARLGFTKRPDGSYPGTFAESTLLLVKVGSSTTGDRCLVCAMGLEKASVLNDGAVLGCIGVVIHEALARIQSFEAHARRSLLLASCLMEHDEFLLLLDSKRQVVEQHPAGVSGSLPAEAWNELLKNTRGPLSGQRPCELALNGRTYNVSVRSIGGDEALGGRHLLVRGRKRSAAPLPIAERLKTYGLSKRESQVAELVFTGRTNQRVAETLFISRDTVKTHCRNIFGKLGISRRTEFLRVVGE